MSSTDVGPVAPIGALRSSEIKSRERQERIITLMRRGVNIEQICKQIGISRKTYQWYRGNIPRFAERADQARLQYQASNVDQPWNGTFPDFRRVFLGFDTYFHQLAIVHAINQTPEMGVTLILVPPEHGKTTLVEDFCTNRICEDPDVRITQVSEGIGHARKIAGRIRNRLEDPEVLPDMHVRFGPFRPEGNSTKAWTADYFTVSRASAGERDYTFEARGWTSRIAGTRSDVMLIDDIQSVASLGQTKRMMNTLRQDILTRVAKTGRTIIVGTRVGMGDVYEEMIETGLVDKVVRLPATDPDAGPQECPLGDDCDVPEIVHEKPLCPEMWPTHALAKRRKQVGESVWWRTYQQRPRAETGMTFTQEAIDGCKDPLRAAARMDRGTCVLGVDPALGGGNAVVACQLEDAHLHMLDVDRKFNLERTEQILAVIDSMAYRYQPKMVVVEEVAFQRGLKNDERLRELGRRHGFSIHGHQTNRNKLDEVIGVASMATSFQLGEITIPWADDYSRTRFSDWEAEFLAWRPEVPTKRLRQDMVMATWFVWLYWQNIKRTLRRNNEPMFTTAALPWSPKLWTPGAK